MPEQTEARRRPGRPRGFDRDAVLHAAMLLFWTQGFDGTSYTDLTKATGMSKPTIYATFGDKVELFRQAMVAYAEEATKVYEKALDQPCWRARPARAHCGALGIVTICVISRGCTFTICTSAIMPP